MLVLIIIIKDKMSNYLLLYKILNLNLNNTTIIPQIKIHDTLI